MLSHHSFLIREVCSLHIFEIPRLTVKMNNLFTCVQNQTLRNPMTICTAFHTELVYKQEYNKSLKTLNEGSNLINQTTRTSITPLNLVNLSAPKLKGGVTLIRTFIQNYILFKLAANL